DLMRDPVTTIVPSPPLEAAATSSACAPVAASCAFAVPKLMAQVATASAQVDARVQLRVFMTCSPQIVQFLDLAWQTRPIAICRECSLMRCQHSRIENNG